MSVRAGELNRRVSVQQRSSTPGNFGAASETWQEVFPAWARILPLGGRELLFAKQIASESSHQVTIRYRASVTPRMRIVYQGRVFEIESVNDVEERHEYLELLCSEGVNRG